MVANNWDNNVSWKVKVAARQKLAKAFTASAKRASLGNMRVACSADLAGQERGRTIPLPEVRDARRLCVKLAE